MNAATVIALLGQLPALLTAVKAVEPDVAKAWADAAHGEGGNAKVQAVLGDLGKAFSDLAGVTPTAAPAVEAVVKAVS